MIERRSAAFQRTHLTDEASAGLNYALCVGKRWINEREVYIKHLDPDRTRIDQLFASNWHKGGNTSKMQFLGHDLAIEDTEEVLGIFNRSPLMAAEIAQCIAENIMKGWPVPEGLRGLALLLVTGRTVLTKPKPTKPSLTHRNTLLVGLAKRISDDCGIPLATSVTASNIICGSAIAAAAFYAFGISISVHQASKIVYGNKRLVTSVMLNGPIFAPSKIAVGHNVNVYSSAYTIPQSVFDMSMLQNERNAALKRLGQPV